MPSPTPIRTIWSPRSPPALVVVGALVTLFLLTRPPAMDALWRDWLTSADHKKIGVMYIVLALVMMARGVAEGVIMRGQQAGALHGGAPQSPTTSPSCSAPTAPS